MKRNNIFKAVMAIAVVVAFIMPTAFANFEETTIKGSNNIVETFDTTAGDYDWPMFMHDPQHTGYSPGTAPNTNDVLWKYNTGGDVDSSPAVVDGKVYIGSDDNKLHCLNAPDGSLLWEYSCGNDVESSPAVVDGRVFFGCNDWKVYCLNASDGSLIWSYTTGDQVKSSPTVVDGKVFIGSRDDKAYCLNASDGSLIWESLIGSDVMTSPAVVDGKVFISAGGTDTGIFCLNASDGSLIWSYSCLFWGQFSPAVVDGKVFFGSCDNRLYCLDASDGSLIWNYTTGDYVKTTPAVVDGKVFFGSCDNNVYCVDALDGSFIWSFATGDWIESSPAVADGKVFIGANDYTFYCLDTSDGSLIWSYITGDRYLKSAPAIADGRVFIGSQDYNVYSFYVEIPEINDVQATPEIQTSGGYVNITATVTDDIEVGTVKVSVTNPLLTSEIMTNIPGTDTYYYNATYTELGVYDYFILAQDNQEHSNMSDVYHFEIVDTTPPEITDVQATPSTQASAGYVNITATVTDDIEVGTVKATIIAPTPMSEIMTNIPGTDTYYYNASYIESGTYDYAIWADDTSGNEDTSDVYHFEIVCNIEIEISGGFGVNVIIRNIGVEDVTDLRYNIALDGIILRPLGGTATGIIDIPAGDEVPVQLFVFGFGESEITVTADYAKETVNGFVFLLFVLGVE